MDAGLKAKWVEALRSDKYKQGTGYLEREGRHCCLGVLCEIQDSEWRRFWDDGESLYTERLPPALGASLESTDFEELAQMNDSGKSFAEIAEHIEANL